MSDLIVNAAISGLRILSRQKLFRTCIRLLYMVLRLLVPTNSRQIAFISTPDLSDNSLAVFETVLKSQWARDYQLVWLVALGNVCASEKTLSEEYPSSSPVKVSVAAAISARGIWSCLRCRYLFVTREVHLFAKSWFPQTIVNLWHGMPIKRIGSYDGQLRSDLFLMHLSIATSEYFADLVAKSFYLPRHRVLVTGLPRNEWLFQFEDRYRALKEGRSTLVAWLPTYRSTRHSTTLNTVRKDSGKIHPDPLDVETLEELDGLLDGSDTVLIIKLHVLDQKNEVSWARYENIRLYTHSRFQAERLNLYKLLAVSDALVTDYSSCAIDYLLLKRPIGIFAPDKSSYSRGFMPGVMEKLAAQTYPLRCVEEFGSFMTHIPQMHLVSDGSDLHQMDLRSPSKAILSAVGLR